MDSIKLQATIGDITEFDCRGGEPACSNFEYGGPLSEVVLLGCLAERAGKTSGGIPVVINRLFWEAEVKITTATIAPHQGAGFSGGRKSVLPGIASLATLKQHHGFAIAIDHHPRQSIRAASIHPAGRQRRRFRDIQPHQ